MRFILQITFLCLTIFLVGCTSSLTGEFIRDTLEPSKLTAATFPSGTHLDFTKNTIGFSNFYLECGDITFLRQDLVTLWNDQEDARIARLELEEEGRPVEEARCDRSHEQYASARLVHTPQEKTLEDCSGQLQRLTDQAESLLHRCLTAVEHTTKNTDEFAFRYCQEDRDCRFVQPISGLNRLPTLGVQGCDCSAAINEKYQDVWYKFRADRDEGRGAWCGPCEPVDDVECKLRVCVPVL